ncbi:MAG TPA: hypothetical protein VF101_11060, partial [Gaiellaceae bacterium]
MDEHLDFGAETTNRSPCHFAASVEAGTGIDPLSPVVHLVDAATAIAVEDNRMHIDLASFRIDED